MGIDLDIHSHTLCWERIWIGDLHQIAPFRSQGILWKMRWKDSKSQTVWRTSGDKASKSNNGNTYEVIETEVSRTGPTWDYQVLCIYTIVTTLIFLWDFWLWEWVDSSVCLVLSTFDMRAFSSSYYIWLCYVCLPIRSLFFSNERVKESGPGWKELGRGSRERGILHGKESLFNKR